MSTESAPLSAAPSARLPRLPFFKPGWMKKALNLSKGVQKFIQYNRDLMKPEKVEAVRALHTSYLQAVHHGKKEETEGLEKQLIASCEGAVPNYKSSAVKENIEVIVVAIVVALGIRAYFLQPFKIPTASMQPTLNGIVAEVVPDGRAFPNPLVRGVEYLARGRNYVDVRIPQEWGTVQMIGMSQRSRLHFFTVTELNFMDAGRQERSLTVYAPARQLWGDLWMGVRPIMAPGDEQMVRSGAEKFTARVQGQPLAPGTLLARGYIDTGDQVLVNKMAYHFRMPKRGEVFVFSTAGIDTRTPLPAGVLSQHYIKRLTAVPGDKVQLVPSEEQTASANGDFRPVATLMINGAPAAEPGMQKVMGRQDGYRGYTTMDGWKNFVNGNKPVQLQDKEYLAMGDNSPDSSDSRVWGPVPQKNLVGPALMVYWPFLPHFGLIR